MGTLAFIEGLLSPAHILLFLFVIGGTVGVVVLVVVVANRASAPRMSPPQNPNADLARRREELELERMAIENDERRRKLGQP